jgi:dCTP deaminase
MAEASPDNRSTNPLPSFITLREMFDCETEPKCSKFFKTETIDLNGICEKLRSGKKNEVWYNLRLGEEAYISTRETPQKLEENDILIIRPGEFAQLTTYESLTVPNDYVGFISMRFTPKSRGLINVSGFQVDPGFTGHLIFSVYNAGPRDVAFRFKEELFIILFARISTPVHESFYGRTTEIPNIPVELIASMHGAPISLPDLDMKVKRLSDQMKLFAIVLTGLISALIALAVGLLAPHG